MRFLLANSFTDALARLPAQEARAVKTTVVDLQIDPTGKGLSFHRIGQSKDPNFWCARVSRDLRLIVHKTEDSLLVAYVDHHDQAYAWAERRRIEVHPSTGAIQIVEVRERVEETAPAVPNAPVIVSVAADDRHPFASLGDDDLLSAGVPADWLDDVRAATEDGFFEVASHLPAEAAEALLQYAAAGTMPTPSLPVARDPYTHPDAQRRIRLILDEEELRQALDYPWERWGVFLHPSQRAIVERRFAGPARVSGSAGTGKTVVALHRAVGLARANPQVRVLLTTFSAPLARSLATKLRVLAPETGGIVPRITVSDWHGAADELFQLIHGRRPRIVSTDALRTMIEEAATAAGVKGFTPAFCCRSGPMLSMPGALMGWRVMRVCRGSGVARRSDHASESGSGRSSSRSRRPYASKASSPTPRSVVMWLPTMRRERASRSTISSSTKRRIWDPPNSPSLPPSHRQRTTRCFSLATAASGSSSTHSPGRRSALRCGAARRI
jgi:hypothetical protein